MDKKERRIYIRAEMAPCVVCARKNEIYDTAADAWERHDRMEACRSLCPDYADFMRYGINRRVEPSVEEVDCLIQKIAGIIEVKGRAGFSENDLERLEVLGHRLSVVVNMEEARLDTARSYLEEIYSLLKGKEQA